MSETKAHPFEALILHFAEKHQPEDNGCSCGFCAWSPTHVAVMAYRDASAHSAPPEPAGATLGAETAPEMGGDTPGADEARVRRYAEAMHQAECRNGVQAIPDHEDWRVRIAACFQCIRRAEAVIAVADEEQAALRAQVERLVRHSPEHEARAVIVQTLYDLRARAEVAEAQVERLTRECLDREATETDARERLRRCEERLAKLEEDRAHPYGV